MTWLVAFLALTAAAAALLASPASLVVRVERTARVRATWQLEWLYGVVALRGSAPGERRPRAERPPRPPSSGRRRSSMVLAVVRTRGLVPRLVRLGMDMVRSISWGKVRVDLEYGLDDPADTGRLHGAIAPVLVAAAVSGLDVRCRPRFTHAGLEGALQASLRARPIVIVGVILRFVSSAPFFRAARAAWRSSR